VLVYSEQMSTILVTGASGGIGAEVARLASARGVPVAIHFLRNERAAESLAKEIVAAGGRALAIQADIGGEQDVVRLFDTAARELGPIAGLVNSAGVVGGLTRVENVSVAALEEVFRVNVIGTILCCREAVKRMSTAHGGSGGSIVNVSSIASRIGGAGEWVHYAASKGAVDSFTLGLAREVAAEGIRVNAVSPGIVETDLHAKAGAPDRLERMAPGIPMKRPGTPHEVAQTILWLLSDAPAYLTGSILEIGGGR
jgi:NAD(P)-dependent dehydrogenase (short-subunit alcohol dehydrogenase family)